MAIAVDLRYAEITLDYFKQGDDLDHYLRLADNNPVLAFQMHAESMAGVSRHLGMIGNVLAKYADVKFGIQADTHVICIVGPDNAIEELVELGLAHWSDIDEDDDEDGDDDDEDDKFLDELTEEVD